LGGAAVQAAIAALEAQQASKQAAYRNTLLLWAVQPSEPLPLLIWPLCWCREGVVHVLQSSTAEEMEENVERLTQWARSWRPSS
jgi:hypothetical protein